MDQQKSRNGILNLVRSERGTISLEAIVMFPAFLTFILMFILCIRILLVEAALQSVANDTVKQLSGIWIPFEEQLQQADGLIDRLEYDNWDFIPESVKPLLSSLPSLSDLARHELGHALGTALKPVIWQQIPDGWQGRLLKRDRLAVTDVLVPYVNDSQSGFGLTLEYRMAIVLPFYKKELIIRKLAYERVWFGV